MALFGGKTDEKKQFMEKYQLEDLDEKDLVVLQRIIKDLEGKNFFKGVMKFANVVEQAQVNYLSTLVEQNWMIIRQLSRLNKNIEDLKKSDL